MGKRYRKTSPSKRSVALALVGIYLLCTALGCIMIWAIPLVKNRSSQVKLSRDKGTEILSAGLMEEVKIYGMDYAIYSETGFRLYQINHSLRESEWERISEYAARVFEKGQIFTPAILHVSDSHGETTLVFGAIAGTVVESNRGKHFASILIRDFSDLETSMVIYVVIFTFLYAIGLFFMFDTIQKERDLNRMRRDLIANVSHELKTPITAIRAMAEVLHDDMVKDSKTRRAYAGKILEESDRLEQMVLDILELSRLQSKRSEFKKEQIHLDGLIPPVVDRYMMLCGDLGIDLDVSGLRLEDAPVVYTDIEKIITLFNTLMDNAVKFTGQGGRIWVSNHIGAKCTTFCIRDNGPGIRSEDVKRIFDRFYKADIAHNSGGSGLGLAIADEIAKGLGEKLWVESKYGEGSAFYFTISY